MTILLTLNIILIDMVYKIAFIGTHGVGKTILALDLERKFRIQGMDALRLPEVAREAERIGFPINQGTTLEAQTYILHRQISEELNYTSERPRIQNPKIAICDRSVFDNYCYLERAFGEKEHQLRMVLGHGKQFPYSSIYLLPIVNGENTNDGTRDLDSEFQLEMHQRIVQFLSTHDIPYKVLPVPEEKDKKREIWTEIIMEDVLKSLKG